MNEGRKEEGGQGHSERRRPGCSPITPSRAPPPPTPPPELHRGQSSEPLLHRPLPLRAPFRHLLAS